MKSTYPIQIGLYFYFCGGNLLSTLGAPLQQCKKTQLHKQNPVNIQNPPCTQLKFDLCYIFRGKLLSTIPPPAKMKKNNFISKIPKTPHKTNEIHVLTQFRLMRFWTFRGNFAKYPGPPLHKCKNIS